MPVIVPSEFRLAQGHFKCTFWFRYFTHIVRQLPEAVREVMVEADGTYTPVELPHAEALSVKEDELYEEPDARQGVKPDLALPKRPKPFECGECGQKIAK